MTVQREFVSPDKRRRAFLRLAYECGYHDGYHLNMAIPSRYSDDEEAGMRYKIGARVGKKERARMRHEV